MKSIKLYSSLMLVALPLWGTPALADDRSDKLFDELEMETGGCTVALKDRDARIEELQRLLSGRETKISTLEGSVQSLNDKLQQQASAKTCDTSALTAKLAALQTQNAQLEQQVKTSAGAASNAGKIYTELAITAGELKATREALNDAKQSNQALQNQVAQLSSKGPVPAADCKSVAAPVVPIATAAGANSCSNVSWGLVDLTTAKLRFHVRSVKVTEDKTTKYVKLVLTVTNTTATTMFGMAIALPTAIDNSGEMLDAKRANSVYGIFACAPNGLMLPTNTAAQCENIYGNSNSLAELPPNVSVNISYSFAQQDPNPDADIKAIEASLSFLVKQDKQFEPVYVTLKDIPLSR